MSCDDVVVIPKTHPPVIQDPVLEGDVAIHGFYPSDDLLQFLESKSVYGTTHFDHTAIGPIIPGTLLVSGPTFTIHDEPTDYFTGVLIADWYVEDDVNTPAPKTVQPIEAFATLSSTGHEFEVQRIAARTTLRQFNRLSQQTTVGVIDYIAGTWSFDTPPNAPIVTYTLSTAVTPVPKIAVLLNGVKLGETEPEFLGSVTSDVLYDDGTTHDSWAWTFDITAAYDVTYPFTGSGSTHHYSGNPGKTIIQGSFSTLFHDGSLLHDEPLDEDFGRIYDHSETQVGVIDYTGGTWQFTLATAPGSGVDFFVTMSFVPPANAPTTLVKRDRVAARARVFSYDWSDLSQRVAVTQWFQKNLITLVPPEFNYLDAKGDLASFIKVFAVTLDELKDLVDSFVEIFNLDFCDPKYLPYIAQFLGYDFNYNDPIPFQRRQLKNAVAWYKVKGTLDSFKIFFYSLGYQITLYDLWTQDYKFFSSGLPSDYQASPTSPHYTGLPSYDKVSDTVPPDDVRLIENGGSFFKSPHFAIELNSITTPNLVEAGLRYILTRISRIRPAHTVLEYLMFALCMTDTVDPQDDYYNTAIFEFEDDGWFESYCVIGDPIYVRSGRKFPNWTIAGPNYGDHIGDKVFPTRNGTDAPNIDMIRLPLPTVCNPPEELVVQGFPFMSETYFTPLRRDGMGIIPSSGPVDIDRIDHSSFPWRGIDSLSNEIPHRDGQYRYLDDLVMVGLGGPIHAVATLGTTLDSLFGPLNIIATLDKNES